MVSVRHVDKNTLPPVMRLVYTFASSAAQTQIIASSEAAGRAQILVELMIVNMVNGQTTAQIA